VNLLENIISAFESYVQTKEIELIYRAEESIIVAFDSEKLRK
jgi:hypothetical protein